MEFEKKIIQKLNIDEKKGYELLLRFAKGKNPNFSLKEGNRKKIFILMYLYFTGSDLFVPEFEKVFKYPGSLGKGLFISGVYGNGKSLLFQIFKEFIQEYFKMNNFQHHRAQNIVFGVIKDIEYLKQFDYNDGHPIVCYIDDLGSLNDRIKNFGSPLNVTDSLLSMRYDVFQRYGKLTHASSNIKIKDLKNIMSPRILDRMNEMFNFMILDAPTMRK